jgi:hypothetical protein
MHRRRANANGAATTPLRMPSPAPSDPSRGEPWCDRVGVVQSSLVLPWFRVAARRLPAGSGRPVVTSPLPVSPRRSGSRSTPIRARSYPARMAEGAPAMDRSSRMPNARSRTCWSECGERNQMCLSLALSRRKQGFESPRERQSLFVHFDFSSVFVFLPKLRTSVWAGLFVLCPSNFATASVASHAWSASRV